MSKDKMAMAMIGVSRVKHDCGLLRRLIRDMEHPPYSCHWVPSQWYSRTRPVAPRTEIARAVEGLPGIPMKTVPFTSVLPPSMNEPVVENFMTGGPPETPSK